MVLCSVMEARALSRLLVACIAFSLCAVQASHDNNNGAGGVKVEVDVSSDDCVEHCDLAAERPELGIDRLLKIGETLPHPDDPCWTLECSASGRVVVVVNVCNGLHDRRSDQTCPDGKAPYKIPGLCCLGCMYHRATKFGVDPNTTVGANVNVTFVELTPEIPTERPQTWTEWSGWTDCSRSCGSGRQTRMRECDTHLQSSLDCVGDRVQIRECNMHHCPVDGGWTDWTNWTDCSASCNNGTQIRMRSCTNPTPAYEGKDCNGERVETKSCFLRHCPIDCVWLAWSDWGNCTRECDGGLQKRIRERLGARYGGRVCTGNDTELRPCNTHHCPRHGGWSAWSQWTDCSVTCNNGTQTRTRACDSPTPAWGGRDCDGETNELKDCQMRPCPIDCRWDPWSDWTDCSLSCDNGTRSRRRGYSPAMHGGKECEGDEEQIEFCNTQACPDPCVDHGNPCYSEKVSCTKVSDTEFQCGDCPRGMSGDGIHCRAVDECELANPCFTGVQCMDYDDGYECMACPSGYRGNTTRGYDLADARSKQQLCTDINECEVARNGGCHEYRNCSNIPGSFFCGSCKPGYVESGPMDCILSDPCSAGVHNCQLDAYCYNPRPGEFFCQCPPFGYVGNGLECSPDPDLDGVGTVNLTIGCNHLNGCLADNCPNVPNSAQKDTDNDGKGDVCDDDSDNDGVPDEEDNCPLHYNPKVKRKQPDSDNDGIGDPCDNCNLHNSDQLDTDHDGVGDLCDPDMDNDGVINTEDKCPMIPRKRHEDFDNDGYGDECDNCPRNFNYDQSDSDQDGVGDVCDTNADTDKDGVQNEYDNCRKANADQTDHDGDGEGDHCDTDDDGDTVRDVIDNCPLVSNKDQLDSDGDGVGDVCQGDLDGDGVSDSEDICPENAKISHVDLSKMMSVNLDRSSDEIDPVWIMNKEESHVEQMANSGPGLFIGEHALSNFEYNGTVFVDTDRDDDFIGIAFNYQSNKRFMLISWKQDNKTYYLGSPFVAKAMAGLEIKVVKSSSGPSAKLRNALWSSKKTKRQVTPIWHDPHYRSWEHHKAYFWNLQYSSDTACMRLKMYDGSTGGMIVDSSCVCHPAIKGGRLGLYVFSQQNVVFSNIKYACLSSEQRKGLQGGDQCS